MGAGATEHRSPNPKVFWPLAVVGLSVMAFGVLGLFHDSGRTNPSQWVRWFVGAALVHDFLVAPVVFAFAALTRKALPERFRGPVNGALITSAVLAAMTFPFLRGYGENPINDSILPNNYALNLGIVLAGVWVVAGLSMIKAMRTTTSTATTIEADPKQTMHEEGSQ